MKLCHEPWFFVKLKKQITNIDIFCMFLLKIIGKKKYPNIPNNPQLFEAFTSQNSSNFPQLTKHPGGQNTPKISRNKKKQNNLPGDCSCERRLRGGKGISWIVFFPRNGSDVEPKLAKGNFGTRFGGFGFGNPADLWQQK